MGYPHDNKLSYPFDKLTDAALLAGVPEVEKAAYEANEPAGAGQTETLRVTVVDKQLSVALGSLTGIGACSKGADIKGLGAFKGKKSEVFGGYGNGAPLTLHFEGTSVTLKVAGKEVFKGTGLVKGLSGACDGEVA